MTLSGGYKDRMKIGLICSSGGHFLQLYSLKEFLEKREHFWVTFDAKDTSSLLKNENVFYAYSPTNRNIINFLRNLILAFRILKSQKPDMIVSTGAGVVVPFVYIAKLFRIKTLYIESITRSKDISLSGKMVYPFTDHFLVQWPELEKRYKRAKFTGQVI